MTGPLGTGTEALARYGGLPAMMGVMDFMTGNNYLQQTLGSPAGPQRPASGPGNEPTPAPHPVVQPQTQGPSPGLGSQPATTPPPEPATPPAAPPQTQPQIPPEAFGWQAPWSQYAQYGPKATPKQVAQYDAEVRKQLKPTLGHEAMKRYGWFQAGMDTKNALPALMQAKNVAQAGQAVGSWFNRVKGLTKGLPLFSWGQQALDEAGALPAWAGGGADPQQTWEHVTNPDTGWDLFGLNLVGSRPDKIQVDMPDGTKREYDNPAKPKYNIKPEAAPWFNKAMGTLGGLYNRFEYLPTGLRAQRAPEEKATKERAEQLREKAQARGLTPEEQQEVNSGGDLLRHFLPWSGPNMGRSYHMPYTATDAGRQMDEAAKAEKQTRKMEEARGDRPETAGPQHREFSVPGQLWHDVKQEIPAAKALDPVAQTAIQNYQAAKPYAAPAWQVGTQVLNTFNPVNQVQQGLSNLFGWGK